MKQNIIASILVSALLAGCGCQEKPTPTRTVVAPHPIVLGNNVNGTVTDSWAEPMNDTIKVPGQIDPTNTYYRASHQTVVEIRPGRYSGVTLRQ